MVESYGRAPRGMDDIGSAKYHNYHVNSYLKSFNGEGVFNMWRCLVMNIRRNEGEAWIINGDRPYQKPKALRTQAPRLWSPYLIPWRIHRKGLNKRSLVQLEPCDFRRLFPMMLPGEEDLIFQLLCLKSSVIGSSPMMYNKWGVKHKRVKDIKNICFHNVF